MDGHSKRGDAPALDGRELLALEARRLAREVRINHRQRIAVALNQSWDFLRRCHALPDLESDSGEA